MDLITLKTIVIENTKTFINYLISFFFVILSVPYDDAELVVLLQSLVLACQGGDTHALSTLSQHLTPLLGPEHLHLLHILVTEMNRS